MTRGSSSSWWKVWSRTCHGWHDSSTQKPALHELGSGELVKNAVHRLQDRLQQTLVLSQRRSHKTFFERATSISKGNAASLWRANGRRRPSVLTTGNSRGSRKPKKPTTMQSSAHLGDRRAREARQDRDNEGGLFSGHRSGFLPNTRRARGGVCTGTQRTPLPTVPAPLHAEVTAHCRWLLSVGFLQFVIPARLSPCCAGKRVQTSHNMRRRPLGSSALCVAFNCAVLELHRPGLQWTDGLHASLNPQPQ